MQYIGAPNKYAPSVAPSGAILVGVSIRIIEESLTEA